MTVDARRERFTFNAIDEARGSSGHIDQFEDKVLWPGATEIRYGVEEGEVSAAYLGIADRREESTLSI